MTREYVPTTKPRISFKDLSKVLLNWKGVLVSATTCSDEIFREILMEYQRYENFSSYKIEERWYSICYSEVPIYWIE